MQTVLKNNENKMNEAIGNLQKNLSRVRAGRANPAILDSVVVDYYGTPTPIQQMASVAVSENRILIITPWDKGVMGDVERAIIKSDIGITPTNDGTVIRVTFPQPTEERRKELVKEVKSLGEENKVLIRNVRRDANDQLKAMEGTGDISEDDIHRGEKDVQELTDKFIKEIDKLVDSKEKEVMEI